MRSLARCDRLGVDRWGAHGWALALTLVTLAPVLGRGYVLRYDMVFVPDPVLNARSLGLDGTVPRAVPADAVVALLTGPVPSWVLQQVLLVVILLTGIVGAWRAAPARTVLGAAATATLYGWNAFLAERLGIGHWSLLVGWALLPWIVRAARGTRGHDRKVPQVLALAGLGAVAAPTAGVLTAAVAAVMTLAMPVPARRRAVVLTGLVAANAVWWLPGLLATGWDRPASTGVAGVESFAARADTPFGAVASLLTFGGVWNGLVVPASRELVTSVPLTLVLLGVAVVGLRPWLVAWGVRVVTGLLALGLLGLGLALLSTTEVGVTLLARLVEEVPGLGLLRDAHKWVMWWLLPVSLGLGTGAERIADAFGGVPGRVLLGCAVAASLLASPGQALGVGGQLQPARWPDDFAEVASALNDHPGEGAALVLPWHAFRAWEWNDSQTVLDPWPRMLERDVVVRDDLELVRRTVPGEDRVAAAVGRLGIRPSADELRALGIRFVVEDLATATLDVPQVRAPPGRVLVENEAIRVIDLGGPVPDARSGAHRELVLTVQVLVLGGWVWLAVLAWHGRPRRLLLLRQSNREV